MDLFSADVQNEEVELDSRGRKALTYYEKSIKILTSVLGENHPGVINAYESIACFYGKLVKNYSKALEYLNKVVQIKIDTYGEDHECVGYSYINIGHTFLGQKEFEKALDYYEKALSIFNTKGIEDVLDPRLISRCMNGIVRKEKEQNHQKKTKSNPEDALHDKKMKMKPKDLSNDWLSNLNNENVENNNNKKKNNKKKKKKKNKRNGKKEVTIIQ